MDGATTYAASLNYNYKSIQVSTLGVLLQMADCRFVLGWEALDDYCLPERMRADSSGLITWILLQAKVSAAAVLPSVQRAPQAKPRERPQPLSRRSYRRPSQPMQRSVQPCAALTPMTYL